MNFKKSCTILIFRCLVRLCNYVRLFQKIIFRNSRSFGPIVAAIGRLAQFLTWCFKKIFVQFLTLGVSKIFVQFLTLGVSKNLCTIFNFDIVSGHKSNFNKMAANWPCSAYLEDVKLCVEKRVVVKLCFENQIRKTLLDHPLSISEVQKVVY